MQQKQIGRNDPCICGSGNKYKKCCGNSDVIQEDKPDINVYLDQIAILLEQDNLQQALNLCIYLLEYYPNNGEILLQASNLSLLLGLQESSISLIKKAIMVAPRNGTYRAFYAYILYSLGNIDLSLEEAEHAIRLDFKNPKFLFIKAQSLLYNNKKVDEAIPILKKIIEIEASYLPPYLLLFKALNEKMRYGEAEKIYQKFLKQNPSNDELISFLTMNSAINISKEQIINQRNNFCDKINKIRDSSIILNLNKMREILANIFPLAYHGENNREIMEKLSACYRKICPTLNYEAGFIKNHQSSGKIRIGFISRYFYSTHPVMLCYEKIIEYIAHQADFEVILFDIGNVGVELNMVKEGKVKQMPIALFLSSSVHELIAEQKCDILAYTDIGMYPLAYMNAFARLAPVQICLAGHPITTGISTIDYYLSSKIYEPEDADDYYSEKLIALNNPLIYIEKPAIDNIQYNRVDFGFPENGNLYAIPASLQKIHPDFYPLLEKISQQDEDAVFLFFIDKNNDHKIIENYFHEYLPNLSRKICFINWIESSKFPYAMELCDIVLDPIHFGIASTLYKLFYMGIPVVTLPGKFLPGRTAMGLLKWIGVQELIAKDDVDYVNIAVKFAKDKVCNASIRRKIKDSSDIIYGDSGAAAELSEILRNLV